MSGPMLTEAQHATLLKAMRGDQKARDAVIRWLTKPTKKRQTIGVAKPAAKRRMREGWWTLDAARKKVYDRSGGICERQSPVCPLEDHPAEHVHHKAGRQGYDPHHPDKLLHLCNAAHRWAHANPELAYQAGFMSKRLGGEVIA